MSRKNRTPAENERRAKIRDLLISSDINSMDDIHLSCPKRGQIVKKAVYIAIDLMGVNL